MSGQTTPIPSQDDFARMEQRLFKAIDDSDKTHKRRKRMAIGASVLLIVGGTSTTWATLAAPRTGQYSASCYSHAATSSQHIEVGISVPSQGPDGPPRQEATPGDPAAVALERCALAWKTGPLVEFQSGSSTDSGTVDQVPTLQLCVKSPHVFSVFPRAPGDQRPANQFCSLLGMEPPS